MNEDFEGDVVDSTWLIGYFAGGAYQPKLDVAQGALNSKRSFRIDFDLAKGVQRMFAHAENKKKRDISSFSGIAFYVKTDIPLTGTLIIFISERENPNIIDVWVGNFETITSWKLIRIPFEQLTIGRGWIKEDAERYGAKPGKQIMDLTRIEAIRIGVHKLHNPPVKGTMWIDKVSFYRD